MLIASLCSASKMSDLRGLVASSALPPTLPCLIFAWHWATRAESNTASKGNSRVNSADACDNCDDTSIEDAIGLGEEGRGTRSGSELNLVSLKLLTSLMKCRRTACFFSSR